MLGWGPLPDQSAGDLKIKVAQVILVAVFFERKITWYVAIGNLYSGENRKSQLFRPSLALLDSFFILRGVVPSHRKTQATDDYRGLKIFLILIKKTRQDRLSFETRVGDAFLFFVTVCKIASFEVTLIRPSIFCDSARVAWALFKMKGSILVY